MAAKKIWVLWTEAPGESPVEAEYFAEESDAKQHAIELAGKHPFEGTVSREWGPSRHEPGLPKYNRDDVASGDPSLWPDFQVLWEIDADGKRSGYFKLDAVMLNGALADCDLVQDHGFDENEAAEARPSVT